MDNKYGFELPSEFKAVNYHGIEYHQSKDDRLYLKSSGMQRCLPGSSYPRCAREGWHLHVVLSGKGILEVGDHTYEVHGGQMFLVKHMEETFYHADKIEPWYYVWVTFDGDQARKHMEYAGFTENVYVMDCAVDPTEFYSVVKEIIDRPHMDISSEVYRKSLALRYLSLAIESCEKQNSHTRRRMGSNASDYIDYAARYIRGNYSHTRISDVVKYVGLSRSHFSSLFKKIMLMSPQEYLMQVRMNKGKELLMETDAPIYVVAQEVGYDDQLTFSKVFKKKFGLSPEQFRKRYHDEHSVS